MARQLYQPHDNLFRKVFADATEAAGLLRRNLPRRLSTTLDWSTLTLQDRSYVDDVLEASQSDRSERFGAVVRYVITTQDRGTVREFGAALQRHVPGPGGDMKTYAEELLREGRQQGRQEGRQEGRRQGRQEGRQEGRIGTIENFLRAGVEWSVIEEATGIDQKAFRALRRRLKESDSDNR